MINKICRLYIIQLWAVLAVWLASYFNGLEIFLSILFAVCIIIESIMNNSERMFSCLATVLLWQLPGILLGIIIITGLTFHLPGGEYYIFVLELWYTPLIPLISLISNPFLPNPVSYNLLLMMPVIMSIYYMLGYVYKDWNPSGKNPVNVNPPHIYKNQQ